MPHEIKKCPLCGSGEHSFQVAAPDRHYGIAGSYRWDRCHGCGLAFLQPMLTEAELGALYPADYYSYALSPAGQEAAESRFARLKNRLKQRIYEKHFNYQLPTELEGQAGGAIADAAAELLYLALRRRWRSFPKYTPGGRLLDVGCGAGAHLQYLQRLGWEVTGVEYSPRAAEAGRAQGLNILTGDLTALSLPGEFDYIFCRHALEHMPQPVANVRKMHALLKKDGRLIISVPNIESLGCRLFREYWYYLGLPVHVFGFGKTTLARLAQTAGLEVESITCDTPPEVLPGSLQMAINGWVGRADGNGRLARSRLLSWAARAPTALVDALGYGDSITLRAHGPH